MRGLFGRDSVYTMLWVLQLVGAAAVTPVVTRLLSQGEYGGVAAAGAIMQIVFVAAQCGLDVAVQHRYADRRAGLPAARGLLALSTVTATLVTALGLSTAALWAGALGFPGSGAVVQFAVLWAGMLAVTTACLALLRSQDRLGPFVLVSLVQSVVAEVLALVLVVVLHRSAEVFVLGETLAQLLAVVLALALARPRLLRPRDLRLIRGGLAFGLPLVPGMLGGLLLITADRLVLQALSGAAAAGRYQVAYNIGYLPMMVLGALDGMWLPRIFATAGDDRDAVLAASRRALFRLLAPAMIGLSLGAPLVLRLWAPPSFRPDALLLVNAVIIVSAIPYAAGQSARRGLYARAATGAVAVANVAAAALNIGLCLLLVPPFGLVGAAAATFVAYTGLAVALRVLHRRRSPARSRTPDAPGSGLGPALVAGAVTLAVVALPLSVPGLVVRAVLAAGCVAWLVAEFLRISGRRPPRQGSGAPAQRRLRDRARLQR
jgi:O-antigen/teichoic acid export membrane protein